MTQQEYENKIKELQDELEQLKAAIIEAEQPKRWKLKCYDEYYYVDSCGIVDNSRWLGTDADEWRYLTGNCFKTEEEAEEYKNQIEYTARYKNYIEEHSEPLDWNNGKQKKYGAYLHTGENVIQVDYFGTDNSWDFQTKYQGMICASSEQIIWDAIEEIGEDNFNESKKIERIIRENAR